jgi:hypothetical protein
MALGLVKKRYTKPVYGGIMRPDGLRHIYNLANLAALFASILHLLYIACATKSLDTNGHFVVHRWVSVGIVRSTGNS